MGFLNPWVIRRQQLTNKQRQQCPGTGCQEFGVPGTGEPPLGPAGETGAAVRPRDAVRPLHDATDGAVHGDGLAEHPQGGASAVSMPLVKTSETVLANLACWGVCLPLCTRPFREANFPGGGEIVCAPYTLLQAKVICLLCAIIFGESCSGRPARGSPGKSWSSSRSTPPHPAPTSLGAAICYGPKNIIIVCRDQPPLCRDGKNCGSCVLVGHKVTTRPSFKTSAIS